MKSILKLIGIAGGVVALLQPDAARATESAPAPIQRIGGAEKICQLTGETDWQTGKPTAARTLSQFGLEAADLGYPVEHQGKLILLFGDSWPALQPPGALVEVPPNDAVGVVTSRAQPSPAACLGMKIQDVADKTMRIGGAGDAVKIFEPATVTDPEKIQQGYFDVPSGGVSVGGALYGFFWTDHCAKGHAINPAPDMPLARPPGDERCPEDDTRNSIGRGVMGRSSDGGRTFTHAVPMPPGFVYSIGVNAATEQGKPEERGTSIFIFGVPRYRASVPYMAEATPQTIADPHAWRFFTGRDGDGQPKWANYQEWAGAYSLQGPAAIDWRPPQGTPEIYSGEEGKEACLGEFSVTWNKPLNQWLLFYNCHGIQARVASEPWGPWSAPATILGAGDDVSCKLVMSPKGCGDRRDFWPNRRQGSDVVSGGFYAPFVLNRYTEAVKGGPNKKALVYWVVSTWNPYEVNVMRSTIEGGPR